MSTALVYLGSSVFVALLLSFFYGWEDRAGHRVVLRRPRAGLDLVCLYVARQARRLFRLITGYLWVWVFHYGFRHVLQQILRLIRLLETRVVQSLRRHRASVDRSDRPRTHLDEIADHKVESSLSARERDKLLRQ